MYCSEDSRNKEACGVFRLIEFGILHLKAQCAGGICFALVRVKVKRYHIRKGMKKIGIKKREYPNAAYQE